MFKLNDRIEVRSGFRKVRYGYVERVTEVGYIIRLDDESPISGGSLYISKYAAKNYQRGDCISYGLYYVRKAA